MATIYATVGTEVSFTKNELITILLGYTGFFPISDLVEHSEINHGEDGITIVLQREDLETRKDKGDVG